MAVEAHHIHLFSPQLVVDREPQIPAMFGNAEGVPAPAAAAGMSPAPFYSAGNTPSGSGLTVSGSPLRKRQRESLPFLGDEISAHFQQHMLDLDLLVARHREAMRAELAERRRRFSRQLAAAIEDGVRKRLKIKDDEIERLRKMNWAMEERIRALCVENQIWRELAQTNEATANFLRANLEQLLAAETRGKNERREEDVDDAESCCFGGNDERESPETPVRGCRSCGEREATVFLLPCRHLCLCAACAPANCQCPVCGGSKSGSVHVNLS